MASASNGSAAFFFMFAIHKDSFDLELPFFLCLSSTKTTNHKEERQLKIERVLMNCKHKKNAAEKTLLAEAISA